MKYKIGSEVHYQYSNGFLIGYIRVLELLKIDLNHNQMDIEIGYEMRLGCKMTNST